MYGLNDTIIAVSSPSADNRVIIRVTGPDTIDILHGIFRPPISVKQDTKSPVQTASLISGSIIIDTELEVDAKLYLFLAPHSYTGDDVAEIHIYTNSSVVETLIGSLLGKGLRMAKPGEFTARAYLNGKMDLAQAEAVNEIITSSNEFQLAAAEKLLAGRLTDTIAKIRSSIMECLGLIEAGLDFSQEDIEFITASEAVEKLGSIKNELEQLLSGSISYESVIDLPAVGIAGAPNAGKSSLLNKLLGRERSIVSDQRRTTRDVLTGLLTMNHCKCVLFDCAGLISSPDNILDELTQTAATEALRSASAVVFCVDVSKADWDEDVAIRKLIEPKALIPAATKVDLLPEDTLSKRLAQLKKLFDADFFATSAKTGAGTELLRETIDNKLVELTLGSAAALENGVTLIARHKQAVTEAIDNIDESIGELKAGNDEITTMMLRAAYQAISNIEQQNIDEEVLETIFEHFCIGK